MIYYHVAHPYIEIEVINTKEDNLTKKDLLNNKKNDFKTGADLTFKWIGTLDNPILHIEFGSKNAISNFYHQEIPFYETVMKYAADLEKYLRPQFYRSQDTHSEKVITTDYSEIYIVLKYTTNFKEPLRNYYRFTVPVGNLIGAPISIEEVEDGFLHFIKSQELYEGINLNKLDFEVLRDWFEAKGIDLGLDWMKEFLYELKRILK